MIDISFIIVMYSIKKKLFTKIIYNSIWNNIRWIHFIKIGH
jgi:hypothetical protein